MIDIRLPEEILDNLPSGKDDLVRHLMPSIEEAISEYEKGLRRRVSGLLGDSLSRYEKAMLRDFLFSFILKNAMVEETHTPVEPFDQPTH